MRLGAGGLLIASNFTMAEFFREALRIGEANQEDALT